MSADEFVGALREYCFLNLIPEHFEAHFASEYKNFMVQSDFAVSLATHAQQITKFIVDAHLEAARRYGG